MRELLTEDTKAVILLCGVLGKNGNEKPLTTTEYTRLAHALNKRNMRPKDLLRKDTIGEISITAQIDKQRLEQLLDRGVKLGFAVEEWQRSGLWVISRSDEDYPDRYRTHLKGKAPPLLFGTGNRALLSNGGLGIVGSRNVDETGESFTRQVAKLCAKNKMPVVSGGARGVDLTAMNAALEAGGSVVGILADNLLRKSVEREARKAIADEALLLCSPYHPNAKFSVGGLMNRNKLIYAMSDYALIVSADHKKGGTWAGAEEELKRESARPVFVRNGASMPIGNKKLMDIGAMPWPDSADDRDLKVTLENQISNSVKKSSSQKLDLFSFVPSQSSTNDENSNQALEVSEPPAILQSEKQQDSGHEIYNAVLPIILKHLDEPITPKVLAEKLQVTDADLKTWLKLAVNDKKITKLTKPVRYQKAQ